MEALSVVYSISGLKNLRAFSFVAFSSSKRRSLLADTPPESMMDLTLYFSVARVVLVTSTSTMACWASAAMAVLILDREYFLLFHN